jgi:hypothetical protein
MNIFVLDEDPTIAAEMLCDKHCIKMILESCQLLSTAHHVCDGQQIQVTGKRTYITYDCKKPNLLKATMINHPCTVWARASRDNYLWLWKHAYTMCKEYTRRYGKVHKLEALLLGDLYNPPKHIPKGKLTQFPQAMPDIYRDKNPVVAYRKYYINEKVRFAKWKKTQVPSWFVDKVVEVVPEPIPF